MTKDSDKQNGFWVWAWGVMCVVSFCIGIIEAVFLKEYSEGTFYLVLCIIEGYMSNIAGHSDEKE